MKYPSAARELLAAALLAGAKADGITLGEFTNRVAERLGVSRRHLDAIAHGETRPELDVAFAIRRTFRAVELDDWEIPNYVRPRRRRAERPRTNCIPMQRKKARVGT